MTTLTKFNHATTISDAIKHAATTVIKSKVGGIGDMFGDYLRVDFTNLPYVSGCSQFTNT